MPFIQALMRPPGLRSGARGLGPGPDRAPQAPVRGPGLGPGARAGWFSDLGCVLRVSHGTADEYMAYATLGQATDDGLYF